MDRDNLSKAQQVMILLEDMTDDDLSELFTLMDSKFDRL